MLYVLILTTFLTPSSNTYPGNVGQSFAITQSAVHGFTTEQACKNAGQQAVNNKPSADGYERRITITYQCSPLSV